MTDPAASGRHRSRYGPLGVSLVMLSSVGWHNLDRFPRWQEIKCWNKGEMDIMKWLQEQQKALGWDDYPTNFDNIDADEGRF